MKNALKLLRRLVVGMFMETLQEFLQDAKL